MTTTVGHFEIITINIIFLIGTPSISACFNLRDLNENNL